MINRNQRKSAKAITKPGIFAKDIIDKPRLTEETAIQQAKAAAQPHKNCSNIHNVAKQDCSTECNAKNKCCDAANTNKKLPRQ